MFVADYPLAGVRPAEYNPRRITDDQFALLQESIKTLGVIRPVIVKPDGLLMAGHQRTKAMRAVGITHSPAHVLEDIPLQAEIMFNLLHNATDVEVALIGHRIQPRAPGWYAVEPQELEAPGRPRAAAQIAQIAELLRRYGEWGGIVAARSGEIIGGHLYARACKFTNTTIRACVVDDAILPAVRRFLDAEYGRYSYDGVPRNTWVQTLKQPNRVQKTKDGGEVVESKLWYETIPRITPKTRLLDFGAGKMAMTSRLVEQGYDLRGVEFFARRPGTMDLDYEGIHAACDRVIHELSTVGLYDAVLCDSVMNSVDTVVAERDVMVSIGALTRPGGWYFWSGHAREGHDQQELRASRLATQAKHVQFYDADGFTAVFDRGVWSFQKYHYRDDAEALTRATCGDAFTYKAEGAWFGIWGRRSVALPQAEIEAALWREFELPWPDGTTVGRGDAIVAAYRKALTINGPRQPEKA